MKTKLFLTIFFAFFACCSYAQDYSEYNGKTISAINVKTTRISPDKVREKFMLGEGDVFNTKNYVFAKQVLHDMRVFKSIDFSVTENEDETVSISIDAKDGYYIFPLLFGTGGSKSTIAVAVMEANYFKAGETAFVFGAFNSDGYSAMGGLAISDNFFSVMFGRLKFQEKVFDNGSYSTSGLFSSSEDLDQFNKPVNKYDIDSESVRVMWSRSFLERVSISFAFDFADVSYDGGNAPKDDGSHNKASIGLRTYKNLNRGGGGFGALFGMGLSDVNDRLADLPREEYGYFAGINYENGGSHTGADYSISKIYFKTSGSIELKKRHIITVDASAAKAFEAPFYDRISSVDILSGRGIYSREFRGHEAVGLGASVVYYLLKNKTGFATLVPFVESGVIWDEGYRRNTTGVGTGISYRFWRIPFPLGINYTHNVTDGSYDVSFLFGGGF